MRNSNISLLIFILFVINPFQTQAQDDPNIGFYVDGVKITELTCYSFGKLTVVLPYNEGYSNYQQFILETTVKETDDPKEYISTIGYTISKSKIMASIKGRYIVLDLLSSNVQVSELEKVKSMGPVDCRKGLSRGMLAFSNNKTPKEKLVVTLTGQTQTSTKEEYEPNCNCIQKTPVYSNEKIIKLSSLTLSNQTKKGKIPCKSEVDLAQPCNVPGMKTDFNNLK